MVNNHEFNTIISWCISNNIKLSNTQALQMVRYLDLIRGASQKINLVSLKDQGLLVERHLLDSLNVLVHVKIAPESKCADLGSGAGFPGVPIAIARPDITMDLTESRRLKSLFLGKAIGELGLKNAKIIHGRWEEQKAKYDYVFARAVYNEHDLRKLALPRLNSGGALIYFEKFMKVKVIKES